MKEWLWQPLGRIFRQRAFVASFIVMGLSAGTLTMIVDTMNWHLHKYPVNLRKSLDDVNTARLSPFKLLRSEKIRNKQIEEALGTQDYIQWELEDLSVPEKDPIRQVRLFITYYTGEPDKVPHIPDVCYTGGGGRVFDAENTTISVPDNGSGSDELAMRMLHINIPQQVGEITQTVLYSFSVNGDYLCDREQVRTRVNSIDDKHAYFSKMEIAYAGKLDRDTALAAAQKLARVVVPILAQEHWPDWKAVKAEDARAERSLWQSFRQRRQSPPPTETEQTTDGKKSQ